MTNLIDSIFAPVLQFLDAIIARLDALGTVAARGIRLDHYFGVFTILGPQWAGVISSLIASLLFLFTLYVVQKNSRVLLFLKDLIKWW